MYLVERRYGTWEGVLWYPAGRWYLGDWDDVVPGLGDLVPGREEVWYLGGRGRVWYLRGRRSVVSCLRGGAPGLNMGRGKGNVKGEREKR